MQIVADFVDKIQDLRVFYLRASAAKNILNELRKN